MQTERFYAGVLGFDVMVRGYPGALFVAAGGYHHHIGLNTWNSRGGCASPTPALSACAPTSSSSEARRHSRDVLARIEAAGIAAEPAADGATLVRDPSGNGVLLTV